MRPLLLFVALVHLLLPAADSPLKAAAPSSSAPNLLNFGKRTFDEDLEHTFYFQNLDHQALQIETVESTPPLRVTKPKEPIAPGDFGSVTIYFEAPWKEGEYNGSVGVKFRDDPSDGLTFQVKGRWVAPIAVRPFRRFVLSTQRGESKKASIEIINNRPEEIEILNVGHASTRFTTEVEPVEPGRRYRLWLTLTGHGPAGKSVDRIDVITTSPRHPFLELEAHTTLHERVYTMPEAIQLGPIKLRAVKANQDLLHALSQRLLIYSGAADPIRISAHTDVPFLRLLTSKIKQESGYRIDLEIDSAGLTAGQVEGSVVILTSDPEFRQLVVPVTGIVQNSW